MERRSSCIKYRTLQQLSGRFLPLGDCMYLTIVSMAQPSSTSPPPPPLLLFSFPRIHLTCLSLNLPLLPIVIMMIGSGPAAICSPPSFLTNHYLHFHFSYCSAHMQWLYNVFFFSVYLTWAWKYMLFWLAKGHSLIFNTRAKKKERKKNEDKAAIAVDVNLNLCAHGQRGQAELKSVWAQRSRFSFFCLSRSMERRRRCDGDVQICRRRACFSSLLLAKKKLSHHVFHFFFVRQIYSA